MRRDTVQTFLICPGCLHIISIRRKYGRQKEMGHIKDMWCYRCREITKHVECKRDYVAEQAAEKMRGKTNMNFGEAIEKLKQGERVARKGWNGKGIFIELQRPDTHSKMTHPYIYIDTTGLQSDNPHAPRSLVPWLASQTDMLAEDWIVVN